MTPQHVTMFVVACLLVGVVNPRTAMTEHVALGGASTVEHLGHVSRQPYDRYATSDVLGRRIEFYVSEGVAADDAEALPLILYVQGSGASSHFIEHEGHIVGTHGHNYLADAVRGRARVLLVEKPGVHFMDNPPDPGSARGASEAFRHEHTLDRWVIALCAAIDGARTLPGVGDGGVMTMGHSEGGLVACAVAAADDRVSHVVSMAGGGATQLYDLIELARHGQFFQQAGDDPDARVEALLTQWSAVMADPDSADTMFLGHPHRRWSSFLRTSPVQQLLKSGANVMIVQGVADTAVHPSSADILRAELLAHGREPVFRLISGADHSLVRTGADGSRENLWDEVMCDAVDWFLASADAGQ